MTRNGKSDGASESLSQLDKFKEAARELETDDREEELNRVLKRIAHAKLPPSKEGEEPNDKNK